VTDSGTDLLRAEVAHWQVAVDALSDLDTVAAPAAWEALERYLQHQIRSRLAELARSLQSEALALVRMFEAGNSTDQIRRSLLALRARYLRAETLLDFYGDAVNSRTNPALGQLLQGYDIIANDSMSAILTPLGIASPPALVYQDKGIGASILRAGIRLWDDAHPSPVAAIKLTRHNLSFPTALLHETGHQVLALNGYTEELRQKLYAALAPRSTRLATLISSWASELAADVHAVHHAGWAPVFALANVVDGPSHQMFRIQRGDPHPPGFVRTLINARLCQAWFGALGPWVDLADVLRQRHPLEAAGPAGPITAEVIGAIDTIIEISSMTPMRSFHGASFGDVLDPRRVSLTSLRELELQAGDTLLTSGYLQRRESVRILSLLATRGIQDPARLHEHRKTLVDWVRALGNPIRASSSVGAAA
jgi:hypothetical protein